MPTDRDAATVLDMVMAARRILEFKSGMDYEAFENDAKTQSAIIHQVLVLGEASKRLSEDYRSAHGDIPWSGAARMRDKMVHHYDIVEPREVWEAAETDIPALLAQLEALL